MKKFLSIVLALTFVLALASCTDPKKPADTTKAPDIITPPTTTGAVAEVPVMTFAEFTAAPLDSKVCVVTYVQAKQSWWENKATFYTQNNEGAYFIYNMPCSEEEFNKLVPGTKIKVTGFKAEWSGEVEIIDATYVIDESDTFIATAFDATALLGTDDLIKHQNKLVNFLEMEVVASNDAGAAYLYNWDGSGEDGSDLYFNVSSNGKVYTFTVESYLCGKDTEVYSFIKSLKVGDIINIEAFLYWYNGANPHVTMAAYAGR